MTFNPMNQQRYSNNQPYYSYQKNHPDMNFYHHSVFYFSLSLMLFTSHTQPSKEEETNQDTQHGSF